MVADAHAFGRFNHLLHHAHCCGQQRRTGDDLAALVHGGLDELLGRHVGAEVDHREAAPLHHNFDKVFANVVLVALDGANADLAGALHARLCEIGL